MNVSPFVEKLLLKQLPYIELCHERIIHQKVHYNKFDFVRIIPKGHKGLLWFKRDNANNTFCYFISLKNTKTLQNNNFGYNTNARNSKYTHEKYQRNTSQIHKHQNVKRNDVYYMKQFQTSYHKYLANQKGNNQGTLLYGTFLHHDGVPYFTTEDVLYFKGNEVYHENWNEKLRIVQEILTQYIKNTIYTKHSIVILSAYTKQLPTKIAAITDEIPYNIYTIQYFSRNKNIVYSKKYTETKIKTKVFNVTASLQDDIYELFELDDGRNDRCIGHLHIPSYKTSVMMNSLFRTIKENVELDFLEESDDEEEFENIREDKYVDLEKRIPMKCSFNSRHNMWEPVSLCE